MSFRSFFHRSQIQRSKVRRANGGHAGRRPRFETFEDRLLLSLTPAVSIPVGSGTKPQAVVAADFNGDGRDDLATANVGNNSVSVLLSNANGTFQPVQTSATGVSPTSMVVGDFNRDSNLDLAAVNGSIDGSSVSVMLGNGTGSFQAPRYINLDLSVKPRSVAVGDFNRYGTMDLAVAADADYAYPGDVYPDDGLACVLLANGDGSFSAPRYFYPLGPRLVNSAIVADLNGDTYPDLVVGITGQPEVVQVLLGDGEGNLNYDVPNWRIEHGTSMAAGLVDEGGAADLVTANGTNVNVRLGDGAGGFESPAVIYAAGNSPKSVALGDFDRDGALDITTSNYGSNDVSIRRGNDDGTFWAPEHFAVGTSGSAAAAGDFDNNGVVETADYVMWRKTGRTADEYDAWRESFGQTVEPRPIAVATGDFNGDGWLDVVTANVKGNSVSVLINDQSWPTPLPAVSVSDATVTEGNTAIASATFTLTLSKAATVDVRIHVSTANSTAVAGSDYTVVSGAVTIPAGEISQTFTVAVLGDQLPEPTEAFAVNLSAPTNATLVDAQGIGTILDNEPRISIDNVSKSEGKGNKTTLFTFTVTLSAAYDQPVTMSYRTRDTSATTSDNDYVAKTGTLTFATVETTKTITIEVKGDNKKESDETFYLDLFNNSINSLFTKFRGIGTIWNDD